MLLAQSHFRKLVCFYQFYLKLKVNRGPLEAVVTRTTTRGTALAETAGTDQPDSLLLGHQVTIPQLMSEWSTPSARPSRRGPHTNMPSFRQTAKGLQFRGRVEWGTIKMRTQDQKRMEPHESVFKVIGWVSVITDFKQQENRSHMFFLKAFIVLYPC